MRLYVVRHAKAAERREGLEDELRSLTSAGRRRFRRLVARADGALAPPAKILSSPLARALQTAEILATQEGFRGEVEVVRALEPDRGVGGLLELVRGEVCDPVALVGHEPQLSTLVGTLLGGALEAPLRKGMIVALDLDLAADDLRGAGRFRLALAPRADEPITRLGDLARAS